MFFATLCSCSGVRICCGYWLNGVSGSTGAGGTVASDFSPGPQRLAKDGGGMPTRGWRRGHTTGTLWDLLAQPYTASSSQVSL